MFAKYMRFSDLVTGMQKREALNCRKIRHFGSEFVVETLICEA